MFSGFFFSSVGTQAAEVSDLPAGTGIVKVTDGAGSALSGTAKQFLRYTDDGTSFGFFDLIRPSGSGLGLYSDGLGITSQLQGGLFVNGGQLSVHPSSIGGLQTGTFGGGTDAEKGLALFFAANPGLQADATGLRVKLAATSGLNADSFGLFVKLPASNPSLKIDASGVDVKIGTASGGMLLATSTGIDADTTKVAALSGGKHTAAQARGMTVVGTPQTFTGSGNVSIPSSGVVTEIAVVSLGTLAIGDWIDISSWSTRDGTTTDLMTLQINSNVTLGSGTIYDSFTSYVNASGVGGSGGIPALYQVTVAGPHYVHLAMSKVSAASAFNCFQRRLTAKVFRT